VLKLKGNFIILCSGICYQNSQKQYVKEFFHSDQLADVRSES
jgi:hypothetical protein